MEIKLHLITGFSLDGWFVYCDLAGALRFLEEVAVKQSSDLWLGTYSCFPS
uniref:Uncharacterized protein n=1 Tax=Rhizophora mucronata TaxID=61149 RepID=A0A2P2N6Q4_RHIMU